MKHVEVNPVVEFLCCIEVSHLGCDIFGAVTFRL